MSVNFESTDWVQYDVHGNNLADVAAAITELPEAGTAEWFPQYEYDHDGRLITDARVSVGTRVTLPVWSESASATDDERREWDRFLGALTEHEQGHLALVQQHLESVDTWLVGRTPDDAAAAWHAALTALQEASHSYDSQTDHGRLTGTVIDLPSD